MSTAILLLKCLPLIHAPKYIFKKIQLCSMWWGGGTWWVVLKMSTYTLVKWFIYGTIDTNGCTVNTLGRAGWGGLLKQSFFAANPYSSDFQDTYIFWTAFYELYSSCLPLAAHCPRLDVIGGDGCATVVDRRLPFDRHRSFVPVKDFRCRGRQGDGWKYEQGW